MSFLWGGGGGGGGGVGWGGEGWGWGGVGGVGGVGAEWGGRVVVRTAVLMGLIESLGHEGSAY